MTKSENDQLTSQLDQPIKGIKQINLARASGIMALGTLTSRLLGFIRSAMLIAVIGSVGANDAFQAANNLPNIIYNLLASSILSAILVPQIVRALHRGGADEFINRILTIFTLAIFAVTAICIAAAPLLFNLFAAKLDPGWKSLGIIFSYWCLPQLFFYGLYSLWGQLLNAKGHFGAYMWAPVVNNVVGIAGLATFMVVLGSDSSWASDPQVWTGLPIIVLAGSSTLGIIVQAVVLLIPLRRSGFKLNLIWGWRGHGLGQISNTAMWAFASLGLSQIAFLVVSNVNAAANGYAEQHNVVIASITAYNTAFMVYMIPQSTIVISIVTALFTSMAAMVATNQLKQIRRQFITAQQTVAVITVFCAVCLMVGATPLMQLVMPTSPFLNVAVYAQVLRFMAISIPALAFFYIAQRLILAFNHARALFFVQLPMTLGSITVSISSYLLLPAKFWVVGTSLADATSYFIGCFVTYLVIQHHHVKLGISRQLLYNYLRLALAAVVTGAVGWAFLYLANPFSGTDGGSGLIHMVGAVAKLIVVGLLMGLVYLQLLAAMKCAALGVLLVPLWQRLRPGRKLPGWLAKLPTLDLGDESDLTPTSPRPFTPPGDTPAASACPSSPSNPLAADPDPQSWESQDKVGSEPRAKTRVMKEENMAESEIDNLPDQETKLPAGSEPNPCELVEQSPVPIPPVSNSTPKHQRQTYVETVQTMQIPAVELQRMSLNPAEEPAGRGAFVPAAVSREVAQRGLLPPNYGAVPASTWGELAAKQAEPDELSPDSGNTVAGNQEPLSDPERGSGPGNTVLQNQDSTPEASQITPGSDASSDSTKPQPVTSADAGQGDQYQSHNQNLSLNQLPEGEREANQVQTGSPVQTQDRSLSQSQGAKPAAATRNLAAGPAAGYENRAFFATKSTGNSRVPRSVSGPIPLKVESPLNFDQILAGDQIVQPPSSAAQQLGYLTGGESQPLRRKFWGRPSSQRRFSERKIRRLQRKNAKLSAKAKRETERVIKREQARAERKARRQAKLAAAPSGRGAQLIDSSRYAVRLGWLVLAVCLAIGVGMFFVPLPKFSGSSDSTSANPETSTADTPQTAQSETATQTVSDPPVVAALVSVDTQGQDAEHPELLDRILDGDESTQWQSRYYQNAKFPQNTGIGIGVTLEKSTLVKQVTITSPCTGGVVEVRSLAGSGTPVEGIVLASGTFDGQQVTLTLPQNTELASAFLWFPELPTDPEGRNRVRINELVVQ